MKLSEPVDLCVESLNLLQNCVTILSMMYSMPKCPSFNLTHRVNIDTEPQTVDHYLENFQYFDFENEDDDFTINYKILSIKPDLETCEKHNVSLSNMDKPSGVLKIWYTLLEGLSAAVINSSNKNQPKIVTTLFSLLRNLVTIPGINFGFYCINHLLVPMVQNWLRQNLKMGLKSQEVWTNFKHCCGLATELVVEYIQVDVEQSEKNILENAKQGKSDNFLATLSLKQMLLVLVECVAQPFENLARLGTSCIRHIILNAGKILTPHQWEIVVVALHKACTVSLQPLQQLISAFKENSDSFYGDLATVKVAARKDSTVEENKRIYELARQIFLMQNQRTNCLKCIGKICDCPVANGIVIDDRSYVFLLYQLDPAAILNSDLYAARVPFRNLVVGVLAHEMLIQTISSALLQNLNHITPILSILQINTCSLRGILNNVNAKHVNIMLKCLEVSNLQARMFDQRPGLKFLTQKVGNLNKAANLYNQANTSEVVQIIVLIELCLDGIQKYNIFARDLKVILSKTDNDNPCTDLEFVEQFIIKLQKKWEGLCDSYVKLTISIPKQSEDVKEDDELKIAKNINLDEFKKDEDYLSTDSESYLEKDTLPYIENEDSVFLESEKTKDKPKTTKEYVEIKQIYCESTDDENQDTAAKYNTKKVYEKYKIELNSIKYDTNTIMQMRKTAISSDNLQKVCCKNGARSKSESYDIGNSKSNIDEDFAMKTSSINNKTNLYSSSFVPPPQPVLPEIQHQRSMSIFKDSEDYKVTRIETMEACLELLSSISSEKLAPLATVLKDGALMLVGSQDEKIKCSAENLLQRMNISYIDHDNF